MDELLGALRYREGHDGAAAMMGTEAAHLTLSRLTILMLLLMGPDCRKATAEMEEIQLGVSTINTATHHHLCCPTSCMSIIDSKPVEFCFWHLVEMEHILHLHRELEARIRPNQEEYSHMVFVLECRNIRVSILPRCLLSSLFHQKSHPFCSAAPTT